MGRYLILFVFFGLLSCDKNSQEDSVPLNVSKILGSWLLSESYISPGGDTTWQSVDDGDIYNFKIDGTFSQVNIYPGKDSRSGSFTYENDTLKLVFNIGGEEKWQSFRVEMEEDIMTITPSGPTICFEACLFRYKKLD